MCEMPPLAPFDGTGRCKRRGNLPRCGRSSIMKNLAQAEHQDVARRPKPALKVAVAGLGAIGLKVAEALDRGIPGCVLAAVSANDRANAAERLSHLNCEVPVVA